MNNIPRTALTLAMLVLAGCAGPAPRPTAAPETAVVGVVLRQPRPGLYSAAQPAATDWAGIAARGITTVINLRPPGEMAGRDEAAEVRDAGMRYIEIPVDDGASITRANARKLHEAIGSAKGAPVLVHCASANRAGGLLALAMATEHDMPVEEALAFGRAAGMKSTEAVVRDALATECAAQTQAC